VSFDRFEGVIEYERCSRQATVQRAVPFILNLCALLHSSAAAERQFSVLSNIKTKLRNSLLLDTIDSLMHAKQLVSRTSGTVHDWEISSDMWKNFMAWYKEKDEETNEP